MTHRRPPPRNACPMIRYRADKLSSVVQMQCLVDWARSLRPHPLRRALPFPREMHDNVSLTTSRHARADAADRVHLQRFAVKYSHARAGPFLLGLSRATYKYALLCARSLLHPNATSGRRSTQATRNPRVDPARHPIPGTGKVNSGQLP